MGNIVKQISQIYNRAILWLNRENVQYQEKLRQLREELEELRQFREELEEEKQRLLDQIRERQRSNQNNGQANALRQEKVIYPTELVSEENHLPAVGQGIQPVRGKKKQQQQNYIINIICY